MKKRFFLPAFTLLFLVLFYVSSAQQNWVHHTGKSCIMLEAVSPNFDSDVPNYQSAEDYGLGSANFYLGGHVRISPQFAVMGELPLAMYNANTTPVAGAGGASSGTATSYQNTEPSGTVLGNPLIGAIYSLKDMPIAFVLATRIPVTGGGYSEGELFAMNAGRFADFERKDAFTRNANPLLTSVSYRLRPAGMDHSLKLAAGGKWVFFAGGTTTNAQVYSATADLNFAPYLLRATYMVYTVDGFDHLQDLFGISAAVHVGRITPGVGWRWLVGEVLPYYAHSAMTFNLTYRFED